MKLDPLSGYPTNKWKYLPADDKPEASFGSVSDGRLLWKRFHNELVLRAVAKHISAVDPDAIRRFISSDQVGA